jgi:hypothetical protein
MNALTTKARSMAPASVSEAMQLSDMLARSAMVPTPYRGKPQDVFVAVMWGAEVGLGPLQALNGVSIINGKPALWGDAALALVRGHPACGGIREGVEGEGDARFGFCEVTRKGQAPERRTFSVADAKRAGLWGKQGPWASYPDRMLQMRARGFAIRDVFPDALRGVITAEEAQDYPEPRDVPNMAEAPLAAIAGPAEEPQREAPFTLRFLDDQLAMFHEADEIRGYLAQDLVQAAYYRSKARGTGERWAAIVQAHFARVDPSMREEPEEPEPSADGLELPA